MGTNLSLYKKHFGENNYCVLMMSIMDVKLLLSLAFFVALSGAENASIRLPHPITAILATRDGGMKLENIRLLVDRFSREEQFVQLPHMLHMIWSLEVEILVTQADKMNPMARGLMPQAH